MTLMIFTHPACSGCGPAVEMGWELANEVDELKLETVKLENEEGLKLAQRVGIKTIPTMICYRGEKEEKRFVGLPDREELRSTLEILLNNEPRF